MRRSAILLALSAGAGALASCASSPGGAVPGCEFAIGGVFGVNREARAVYSVETRNGVPLLQAMAVIKYDVPVRHTKLPEWPSPPFPRGGVGGSIDTLIVVHDEASNRLWLHTRPIELGTNNVILVDRNAAGDGVPRVIAAVRVDPTLAVAPLNCDGGGAGIARALGTKIEQTSEIRDFVQIEGRR
jgi:hypothetical protein